MHHSVCSSHRVPYVLTPINSFITDDTNEATRLNRLTGSKGKTAIAMPNAVLISERITCLKLYRQVFQGLKAHCYSQRLSLFFALLFSCVCSDCDAVGVTFLPTSANLYRHIYCTIFLHSTGLLRTFGLLHFKEKGMNAILGLILAP